MLDFASKHFYMTFRYFICVMVLQNPDDKLKLMDHHCVLSSCAKEPHAGLETQNNLKHIDQSFWKVFFIVF